MPHSYYIIHLEEKDKQNKIVYAQLRRFAYPGAFASSVWDEFDLKEYGLHPTRFRQFSNPFSGERKVEVSPLSWSEIISVGNREDLSYIMQRCREIFMERNPNIDSNKMQ